jgi:hypothetical protein
MLGSGWLLTPKMAFANFNAHYFTGAGDVQPTLGAFMCLKLRQLYFSPLLLVS